MAFNSVIIFSVFILLFLPAKIRAMPHPEAGQVTQQIGKVQVGGWCAVDCCNESVDSHSATFESLKQKTYPPGASPWHISLIGQFTSPCLFTRAITALKCRASKSRLGSAEIITDNPERVNALIREPLVFVGPRYLV